MEQTVQMKIGKRIVQIPIQGAASVETILPNEMKEITDLRGELIRSMTAETIGSPSIDEVIGAEDQVTIIISDITRTRNSVRISKCAEGGKQFSPSLKLA